MSGQALPVAATHIGFDYLDNGQLVATYAPPVKEAFAPALYASQLALPAGPVPENVRHALNEWADAATSALQWLRNIADGTTTDHQQAIENTLSGIKHAQEVTAAALAPKSAAGSVPTTYVECRECDSCGHTGLNDADGLRASCNTCGWTGDSPEEDKCPDCQREGTMSAACPKCGERYRLIAAKDIADPSPAVVPAGPVPEGFVLVPMHLNAEMREVLSEEDWTWEDLLVAANAVTEEQYYAIQNGDDSSPAVAQPVADEREASDAYFKARHPMLDTAANRNVFSAGFRAALGQPAEEGDKA